MCSGLYATNGPGRKPLCAARESVCRRWARARAPQCDRAVERRWRSRSESPPLPRPACYAGALMNRDGSRFRLDDDTWVLALTGAGVSAESGIPTFRDAGGLWEQHRVEDVASPDGFRRDPALVWRFYSQRRAGMTGRAPNPGHHALAEVEARLGDRFLLATQNIDGLHAAAGSRRVVELHG